MAVYFSNNLGYLPSMMVSGYMTSKLGAVMVSALSIGFSSIGTIVLPLAARWNLPALFVCRILIGVAQVKSSLHSIKFY